MRQPQNIKDVAGGLPVVGDAFGFGAVLQARSKFGPLYSDVLDKLRVQFLGLGTALAPIQDKLGDGLLNEFAVNFRPLHDLHSIRARAPAIV